MHILIHRNPRARLIAVSILSALLAGGACFAFWRMTQDVLRSMAVGRELQAQIDDLEHERIEAKEAEKMFAERAEDYKKIKEFYVDAAQPVAFLKDLEAIGRATGVKLAVDLNGSGRDERYLALRLTVEGAEDRLLSYARLLERLPYHLEITEVAYQNPAAEPAHRPGDPSGRFEISFRVRTR